VTRIRTLLRNAALLAFHLLFVRPVLYWFVGVRYRRRSLVPDGRCLVVANHNSHLDAAVLMSLFPLRRLPHVHPVAAADYFGKTWLRQTMAMLFMNGIPIERTAAPGKDVLAPVLAALDAGESLVFFPEGSRGEAGVVAPFRPGIGRLVQAMPDLPIVPVFMHGPERVWPRGELVPVPFTIEANVGRPRAYPPALEPREIAEQVRRDVLALAPPPAPPPSPRPGPPPRVAVCGILPELRRQVVIDLAERLGRLGFTVGVGRPMLIADEAGVREEDGEVHLTRSRWWLAFLARMFRIGGLHHGSRFTTMVESARMDEALQHGRTARFVVADGSALVDLMAWADAGAREGPLSEREWNLMLHYLLRERRIPPDQWWHHIRRAPAVWLMSVLHLARLQVPDVLALVTVRPDAAPGRIEAAGRDPEPHETAELLVGLQASYARAAEVLRRRKKTEVLVFDGEVQAPQEIAAALEEAMRRSLDAPDASEDPSPETVVPATPAPGS
jgi:1-acyl-sn-glycerol-3-phosphate acyltransferase